MHIIILGQGAKIAPCLHYYTMNKNSIIFLILLSATLIVGFVSKEFLDTNSLLLTSIAEQFTSEEINEIISFQDKLQLASYVIIPILLLMKISIISVIIDIGCFFFNKKIKYKKLFNIVMKAEYIFLLVIIFKTGWFYFFQINYTLEDLQYFYPLSVLNIVGYEGVQPWFIYPFQVLNLFELTYWFFLSYLLSKELKITTDKGLQIVASSYGAALLIWVVGFMFFNLNMS